MAKKSKTKSKNKDKKKDSKSDKKKPLGDFDKYEYYSKSVQSPKEDVKFLRRAYLDANGHPPEGKFVLREDFCGTFLNCCHWSKLGEQHYAHGVDLEPETIEYGRRKNLIKLTEDESARITLHNENVLSANVPKADVVAALNFSYFIFKERQILKDYFTNCFKSLNPGGALVLDCFGGSQCMEANEEITEYKKFKYYWDQDSFDPISHHGMFYIHFKRQGEKKREKAFVYDWRMWTIPELKDVLAEVGFRDVKIYWEGTDEDGEGDGEFTITDVGEECESWICYIVASSKM
jgi:SAM-dependent methyltransferase